MKSYFLLGLALIVSLILTSCATRQSPILKPDLTRETWIHEIAVNPVEWTQGADQWFLTGKPNSTELTVNHSPYSAAVSTMSVNVPNFSQLLVNGDFEVQVFGTDDNNSVYIYGPNQAVRQVAIEVKGNTLYVMQTKKISANIRKVIVRIGMNQLHSLIHLGRGVVEGVRLRSNGLAITSSGSGNLYLAGNMNVRSIVKTGSGCVNIFGANTPVLDIKAAGFGELNVSGNVGVRSIIHRGRTDINIIGANSDQLRIHAGGRGKIGINGIVNLRELNVRDLVRVYIDKITSSNLYIYAYGNACVGLSGNVFALYLDAFSNTTIAAKNLCAATAYVRAHDSAHINIASNEKIFAAATGKSSVYFFGTPAMMSQFVNGHGTVIPIWSGGARSCPIEQPVMLRPYSYKVDGPAYKGDGEPSYTYSKWKKKQMQKHQALPSMQGEG